MDLVVLFLQVISWAGLGFSLFGLTLLGIVVTLVGPQIFEKKDW